MNLHSTLGKPLIKSNVILICRLIETMKNIGYIYQKNHIVMDKLITDIIQYFEFLCLSIIGQVKVRVVILNIFALIILYRLLTHNTFYYYSFNHYRYILFLVIIMHICLNLILLPNYSMF